MRVTRQVIARRTMAEVYGSAQALHLPVVPVYSPAEFLRDEQTVARGLVVEVLHRDRGAYRTLRPPLALREPSEPIGPAPSRGEHNEPVHGALAGLTTADLAHLREAGIV